MKFRIYRKIELAARRFDAALDWLSRNVAGNVIRWAWEKQVQIVADENRRKAQS